MHLPSLKDVLSWGTFYVTGASVVVNVLPKDSFLDDYPRAKKAYNSAITFLAVSALNLRKCLPALGLHIPGLGFDKPAVLVPNPNPESAGKSPA